MPLSLSDDFSALLSNVEVQTELLPTERALKERKEEHALKHQQGMDGQKLQNEINLTGLRKKIGFWIFWLATGWLVFVVLIMVADSWKWIPLSDKVLITLLTTTTINIIAMLYAIVTSLYPKSSVK